MLDISTKPAMYAGFLHRNHRPTAAGAAAGRDKNEAKEDDCEDKHMNFDVWYLHFRHIPLFSQSITSLAMKGKGFIGMQFIRKF